MLQHLSPPVCSDVDRNWQAKGQQPELGFEAASSLTAVHLADHRHKLARLALPVLQFAIGFASVYKMDLYNMICLLS